MIMPRRKNAIKQGGAGYTIFQIVTMALFLLFAFACIYPFWYIIIYSFSNPTLSALGLGFLPRGFTTRAFEEVLKQPQIYSGFIVSTLRSVVGTVLTLFFSAMFAYVLTKDQYPMRKFIYRLTIVSMYIQVGLIPWFLTMRAYGLKDNFLLYVIPGAVSAFYVVLIRTYIQNIPDSIEEAALIDGANFFQIYTRIVLPVCKPVLAAVAVFSAVGQWNSWTDNMFLVSDPNLQTMQYMLYKMLNQAQALVTAIQHGALAGGRQPPPMSTMVIQMCSTVITVIPIILVYPFLQRYFVKGIMMGAVKA